MGRGVKVGMWSFIIDLAVWTAALLFRNHGADSGLDHAFVSTALFLLVCAAVVGLFGVGFALADRDVSVRARFAAVALSLPSLGTAAFLLLLLSQIPST